MFFIHCLHIFIDNRQEQEIKRQNELDHQREQQKKLDFDREEKRKLIWEQREVNIVCNLYLYSL